MSNSQKVLRIFGILEILMAILAAVGAVMTGGIAAWLGVAVSLVTGYLLLLAAKDASKIGGAWLVTLVGLILNTLSLILALIGSGDKLQILSSIIAVALSLAVFIAANNVKKQAK